MLNKSIEWQQVAPGVEVYVGQVDWRAVGDFDPYCCERDPGGPGGGASNEGIPIDVFTHQDSHYDYVWISPIDEPQPRNPLGRRGQTVSPGTDTLIRYKVTISPEEKKLEDVLETFTLTGQLLSDEELKARRKAAKQKLLKKLSKTTDSET